MGINKYNSEGYYDPTVYEALSNIEKEEKAARRVYRPLVYICSPYAGDIERNVNMARIYSRLKVTVRTTESVEEYARFPKSKKDAAKDHGGFVAGVLKGGRRKVDTVVSRSMVALDGDRIEPGFLEDYEKKVSYASALYSTHSHTPDTPRVRLVFPLARDVTPEEYVAVARYLAQSLGMDYFDECSGQWGICLQGDGWGVA